MKGFPGSGAVVRRARWRRFIRPASVLLRLFAVSAVVLALLPPAIAAADDIDVLISDTLRPAELTAPPGTTITFVNQDPVRHRMRSIRGPTEFDSGNLEQGESYSITLVSEGTYRYVDDRDRDNEAYHGSIVISAVPPPTEPEPSPTPPPGPPATGDVTIVDRVYRPARIEVGVGAAVTFVNNDDRAHTVTATDRSWDSGIFDTGGSYRRVFDTAGTVPYFCTIHPDMRGEVVVVAAGGDPPPAPPSPAPSTTTTTAPPAPPGPAGINIVDFAFAPSSRTVVAGSTVTWTNTGLAPHTVAADDASFESRFLLTGDTFARTFSVPGSFAYFCTLHPAMRGTIVVTGTATGSDPPPPDGEVLPPPPEPADRPEPSRSGSGITIVDNAFSPQSRTISTGTTLRWTNAGRLPHTVTARDAGFDSGILAPGDGYRRTFSVPGVFNYFCTIHPGMTGVITVVGSAVAAASESDPEPLPQEAPAAAGTGPPSVTIVDNEFLPATLDAAVGDVVSWTNTGALPHTVTATDAGFDSGFLMPGEGFSLTATSPGRIEYFCTIHPGMVGAINVRARGPAVAAAPPLVADSGDPPAAPPVAATGPRVRVVDLAYEPTILGVEVGAAVTWNNAGALPHTVTARDGRFDSGVMAAGDEYTWTFDRAGTFEYFCTLHPEMVGIVEVTVPAPVDVTAAAAIPVTAPEAVSIWFAVLLASSILLAMVAFVVGMNRFGRMAESQR